jgi:hypothetical protein
LPAGVFQSCIYGNGKFIVLVRHVDQATFDQSAKANPGGAVPVTGIGQDAYVGGGTDLLFWQNGTETEAARAVRRVLAIGGRRPGR